MFKLPLIRLSIVPVILVGLATEGSSQSAAKLRYAFVPGEKIQVMQSESTHDRSEDLIQQKASETANTKLILQNWLVKSVSPDGDATIESHYTAIGLIISPAPGLDITLSTTQPIKDSNPQLVQLGAQGEPLLEKLETNRKILVDLFIPRTFTIVVSDTGVIKKVSGFDEAMDNYRLQVEKIVPDKQKRSEIDALIEGFFGSDAVQQTFSYTLFQSLPTTATPLGTEWTDSFEFSAGPIKLPIKRTAKFIGASGTASKIDGLITFSAPKPTEEIDFKVVSGTLKAQISLDPTSKDILTQDYQGTLVLEAYSREAAGHPLTMRTSSAIDGRVLFTRLP